MKNSSALSQLLLRGERGGEHLSAESAKTAAAERGQCNRGTVITGERGMGGAERERGNCTCGLLHSPHTQKSASRRLGSVNTAPHQKIYKENTQEYGMVAIAR